MLQKNVFYIFWLAESFNWDTLGYIIIMKGLFWDSGSQRKPLKRVVIEN